MFRPRLPIAAVLLGALTARAQTIEPPRHRYEFALFAGGTVAGGHALGFSHGRSYTFLGAQLATPIARLGPGILRYRFELLPVIYLREPKFAALDSHALTAQNRYVYGIGANPVAFDYGFQAHHHLAPFADFSGGLVHFSDRAFSPAGARFNFTVALGGGVNIHPDHLPRLKLGYRYLHISNANIANRNPGGDFQL